MLENKNTEEIVLWNELRKGNVVALGKVYDIFIDDLFSYGIQFSEDRNYVMDCIHDLFLDLYKYQSKLSETNNVKYYLLKSLKRKIIRKHNEKTTYFNNEVPFKYVLRNHVPSPEEELIAMEKATQKSQSLYKATEFLTKRQQKGLSLRFKEKRSYEEIAEIMNTSVETSRTIIYRAIKSLRKNIVLPLLLLVKVFF
ncbi:RNA polymerase sigma factor [Flagellimonas pacifica]|uniref:RNA polymerase sigma factor, sigma-70 family n=1 Tax=Flagellimonas pacifica TaxID=1247520 RepID=A0A285MZS4_9FLAO|nr:sigma-70 family RNA polymerase sigma factor [Allomuricauda parva]SNZ01001.1 RNA polymerase sigma factor, sigma-70 family [Allomuricauda parva]